MNRCGLLALLGLFLAGACSKPGDTTVVGADGSRVTTSKDSTTVTDGKGNTVEVSTDQKDGVKGTSTSADGKTTAYEMGGNTTVTEADLGFPMYAGASKRAQDIDTKATVDGKTTASAMRFSTDSVDKIYEFYSGLSVMKTKTKSGNTAVTTGDNGKGTVTVTMTPTEGGTAIMMAFQSK